MQLQELSKVDKAMRVPEDTAHISLLGYVLDHEHKRPGIPGIAHVDKELHDTACHESHRDLWMGGMPNWRAVPRIEPCNACSNHLCDT